MKSLMADLSDEEISAYIAMRAQAGTPISDPGRLHEQVRFIREHGYCSTIAEQTPGAAGVGAPVRNHAGEVVAALTISGPESRFTEENIQRFSALVTRAAAGLSRRLGNV